MAYKKKDIPQIVLEIQAKFPNGIFTQSAFRKKLKVGKTFFQVGLIMGQGPTKPERRVLKKITQRRYRTNTEKYSFNFDKHISDTVSLTEGVFLSEKEANSYYRRLKNASRKDSEYIKFLLDQRQFSSETPSFFDMHRDAPFEGAISSRLRSAGL